MIETRLIRVPGLSHQEQNALDVLIQQWRAKRPRNNLRTAFYDMKNSERSLMSGQVPRVIRRRRFVLGWSSLAVDKLNRRCNLEGFYDAAGANLDSLGMGEYMRANRLVREISQAGTSSLIHSCSFLVTTLGDVEAGEPKVLTLACDATMATGTWNRRLHALDSFLAIHRLNDDGEPVDMTMHLPNLNVGMVKVDGAWRVSRRAHQYGVPVDPLRYQERIDRPFGSSRINRTVMSLHMQGLSAMIRADVNGEAYSLPRFVLLGATEEAFKNADGSPKAAWQAAWDAVWAIGDDDALLNSQAPALARADVKQFNGQSPEPQNAHLRMLAQMFSGETGIPLGELGIIGDANPTSAEALLVSRDDLIAEAGVTTDGWSADVASAAHRAMEMWNDGDLPDSLDIRPNWRNPVHASRAQAADSGSKVIDKFPWLADTEVGLELVGLTPDQARRAMAERRRATGRSVLERIASRASGDDTAE